MKNILVVDDDKCIRDILSLVLSGSLKDCAVLTAENGAAAAAIFESVPVSAVISDISMPIMNGYQLMAHIRARSSTVPIIAMSGDPDVRERLLSLGVHRFLEKPFNLQNAIQMIESELGITGGAPEPRRVAAGAFV